MDNSNVPEWLLQSEENYLPPKDKDGFINKSILSFIKIISKIRADSGFGKDRFEANAALKLLTILLIITLVSVSGRVSFVVAAATVTLLFLSFMTAEEIIRVLKVDLVVSAFTLIIMLPSFLLGNSANGLIILVKVVVSVTLVNIFSHTTNWNSVTAALKMFYIPDILIFILDITLKYIVMLGEFSLNMLYSLKLRSVGKNTDKYSSISGVAGTMFLKSRQMAEEMYMAMECRGFNGKYMTRKFKVGLREFLYIISDVLIVLSFIYL